MIIKCPHCGKNTATTPLIGLKSHIQTHIENCSKRLTLWTELGFEKRNLSLKNTIQKWQSWADAITELEAFDKDK